MSTLPPQPARAGRTEPVHAGSPAAAVQSAGRRPHAVVVFAATWLLVLGAGWTRTAQADPSTENRYPSNGQTGVSINPTLEIDCSDPNDVVSAQYVIARDAAFTQVVYDSGESIHDVCQHVAFAHLDDQTQYWWRARIRDGLGALSPWSASTSFTTVLFSTITTVVLQDGIQGYAGTRDADIRGSFVDPSVAIREWNQGAQNVLRSGRRPVGSPTDEIYRTLLRFDLSALASGASVVNAYIVWTGTEHGDNGGVFDSRVLLYEIKKAWGEGDGTSEEAPAAGECSWTYHSFPTGWTTPGCEFASDTSPSADRAATSLGDLAITNDVGVVSIWSSEGLVDAVQRWIDQPATNHGIILVARDESIPLVLNLASREDVDPLFRPRLVIETTEPVASYVNQAPVASGDVALARPGLRSVIIPVVDNDADPDDGPEPLRIISVTTPLAGRAVIHSETEIRYEPDREFIGTDAFTYRVSDGVSTATAEVIVLARNAGSPIVSLEAEDASLVAPMALASDSGASGGLYAWVPPGTGDLFDPDGAGGTATFTFDIPRPGFYVFNGRVRSDSGLDNSFYASLDGEPFHQWHTRQGLIPTSWVWDPISIPGSGAPIVYSLEPGSHTLVIKQREDGTRLDRILVTGVGLPDVEAKSPTNPRPFPR